MIRFGFGLGADRDSELTVRVRLSLRLKPVQVQDLYSIRRMAGPSESAGECTILLRPLAHLRPAILPVFTQYTELLRDLGDYTRRWTQTVQPSSG